MQEEQGVPKEDWKKCRDDLSHILLQMASLDHFREMDEGSFFGVSASEAQLLPYSSQPQKQEMEPKEESHTLIEASEAAAEVA